MDAILFAYMQDGTLPEEDATCSDLKMNYGPDYEWPEAPLRSLGQVNSTRRLVRRGQLNKTGTRWDDLAHHQPYHERYINRHEMYRHIRADGPKMRLNHKAGVGRFAGFDNSKISNAILTPKADG